MPDRPASLRALRARRLPLRQLAGCALAAALSLHAVARDERAPVPVAPVAPVAPGAPARVAWPERALGVCWEGSPRPVGAEALDALAALGPNALSQTPFAWMEDPHAPELRFDPARGWWGESVEGVAAVARLARERGLKTLLKPHIWLHGSWPGEIEMRSEADWARWFARYREFALFWARQAAELGLEGYCIGTELDHTLARATEWRALIAEIRAIYAGPLTYAANWTHFEEVPFWSELDAIGVNAYFPLSQQSCPSVDELVRAWQPIRARLAALAKAQARPVLFTEIGYHASCFAFREPWLWKLADAQPHAEDQLRGYEAVQQAFGADDWFGGVYWWKWHAAPRAGARAEADSDFSPQGKPAAARAFAGWPQRAASAGASSQPAAREAAR